MKNSKPNHKLNLKRLFVRGVALLFVIYALADVSVLQAFCGNESVGIPPAHHFAKSNNNSAESENSNEDSQNNFQQSHDQEDSEQNCGDDCCFCNSHVVISSFAVESNVMKVTETKTQSISYENKHSNSERDNLFRPPQIA